MGIKPVGSENIIVPPDNVQNRWGEWEADINNSGEIAGEVVLETWTLAASANQWVSDNSGVVYNLLQDSAGIGDETKTIQEQMRDLLDPENPDSELWRLQDEVNTLQDERNELQDQMIALNRQDIDTTSEFVSRTLVVPGGHLGNGNSDDFFSVVKSGVNWNIVARGNWTGKAVLHGTWASPQGMAPVLEAFDIPTGNPASPRAVSTLGAASTTTVIHYWVRNAVHETDDKSTGSFTAGAWASSSALTFTAPVTANYSIYYRVVWNAATFDDWYSFRVLRNGDTIMQWGPVYQVGPRWSWQSGVRTRTMSELSVPLSAGDVIEFQTYSDAGTAAQRAVRSSERKISWYVPATG